MNVPVAKIRRAHAWLSVVVLIGSSSGCGSSYHIHEIEQQRACGYHVSELARYPLDARATGAVVDCLRHPRADVRFFAAEAAFQHLKRPQPADVRDSAFDALVGLLDDDEIGKTSWPAWGPGLPGVSGRTGSVRARALLTLSQLTGADYGFSQEDWREFLKRGREGSPRNDQ